MRVSLRLALGFASLMIGFAQAGYAQMNDVAYVITYIEVTPAATEQTVDLLVAHGEASRHEDGNSLFQVLQRIGRPNHFAVIETWENADAQAAHADTAHTKAFRASIEPVLFCCCNASFNPSQLTHPCLTKTSPRDHTDFVFDLFSAGFFCLLSD